MILFWTSLAVAAPDWSPEGPERGHVVDFDSSEAGRFSATRVGVMKSSGPGQAWTRDSRFPTGTRRLASAAEVAWAAPPGQLWEVGAANSRLVTLFKDGIAVDLEALESGSVLAAVRGNDSGVWLTAPGGTAERVLSDVDPWTLSSRGSEAWVGTIGQGLWYSDSGGRSWERVQKGSISALGIVGDDLWVGQADGSVKNWDQDQLLTEIPGGHATHIAGLSEGEALLVVSSQNAQTGPLQLLDEDGLKAIREMRVDEDIGLLGPTGAWPSADGTAIVGSFRRGPLVWNGRELSTDRSGFQAMVSGGAAMDAQGRLVVGAMGTGVYIWEDDQFGPHRAGQGPVTDTVGVKRMGDQVTVIDFEGLVSLNSEGQWSRIEGVQDVNLGRRNGLIDVGQDSEGGLWGIDSGGILYQRVGTEWERCRMRNATRLDGDGDHLVVATERGFFHPSCQEAAAAFSIQATAGTSRALGGWVATPGQLYGGGDRVGRLPPGDIEALALSERGLLVAISNQSLLLCSPKCAQLAPPIPGRVDALGWLPDGRVWVMEEKGTLLLLEDGGNNPGPWSEVISDHPVDWSQSALLKNPWMQHTGGDQRPHGGKAKRKPPPPGQQNLVETPSAELSNEGSRSWWPLAAGPGFLLLLSITFWSVRKSKA